MLSGEAEQLAHLACANPARFHRMLRSRLPGEAGVYDESTGPSPEKCAEFRDFFAALLAKLRGDVGSRSPPLARWWGGTLQVSPALARRRTPCLLQR